MKKLTLLLGVLASVAFMNVNANTLLADYSKNNGKHESRDNNKSTASEVMSDSMITAKVKEVFVRDDKVSALSVSVETDKGVVTLTGDVKSKSEVDAAVRAAKKVKGVKKVVSKLVIEPEDEDNDDNDKKQKGKKARKDD